jgi:hypothetical protein
VVRVGWSQSSVITLYSRLLALNWIRADYRSLDNWRLNNERPWSNPTDVHGCYSEVCTGFFSSALHTRP